jgi:RNA polymerase sigma factor (sigma-70 family)
MAPSDDPAGPTQLPPTDPQVPTAVGMAVAWSQFYDYCFDVIRRSPAMRRLSESDREDCVQDVMMEIVRRFGADSPEGIKETHAGWIQVVTRNKATDIVRRRYRKPDTSFDDGSGALLPSPAHAGEGLSLEPRESISLVWEALLSLDQKVAVTSYLVFYLRTIEDWDVDEIAELFGMTPDQVRSRCHRVRKMFGETLRRGEGA